MVVHGVFPTTLPKFGFHIWISEPANLVTTRDFPIEINIYLPGDAEDKPSLSAVVPADQEAAKTALADLPWHATNQSQLLARSTFNWIVSPLVLKEPGVIRVRAKYAGDSLRCGSLQVVSAETLTSVSKPTPP